MKSHKSLLRYALTTALCSLAITCTTPLLASGIKPGFILEFADAERRERNSMFQPADPFFSHRKLGLTLQLEHTLRLPSGSIVTHGPVWSAESHAATRLSGNFGVPSFGVPTLRGTWSPGRGKWRLSLSVSDLTRENLFTNLADLSATDINRLRLWPDRHWWFGLERRF